MRDNTMMAVCGKKRIGKSYKTFEQMLQQAYFTEHRRKVLYFDVNGEYGGYEIAKITHRIKEIGEHEIIKYSNSPTFEIRRIVPKLNPQIMNDLNVLADYIDNLLMKILVQFRNGILVVEDLNATLGDNLPQRFTSTICNNAHRNCDIILHIQSAGRLVPKVRQNCEYVRFHYQLDDMDDSKSKLKGDYEIFKIAQLIVNKQFLGGNKRFFVLINREEKKLSGKFSPRMMSEAIQEYLTQNMRKLKPILDQRDKKGKKIFTYEQALNKKTEELFGMFWGN